MQDLSVGDINAALTACSAFLLSRTGSTSLSLCSRRQQEGSLPKLSSQDDDGSHQQANYTGTSNFEPIPHDHDSCERVVIN
ncbi:hypothetical protein FHG87_022635, partial [Trinorchestia longiramus]